MLLCVGPVTTHNGEHVLINHCWRMFRLEAQAIPIPITSSMRMPACGMCRAAGPTRTAVDGINYTSAVALLEAFVVSWIHFSNA